MKKVIIVLMVSMLCLASTTTIPPQSATANKKITFTDLEGHWAEEAIYAMIEQGVVNGFEDGTFRPDDPVQEDQFYKMLVMYLSAEQADGTRWWKSEFVDNVSVYTRHNIYMGIPGGFDFTNAKEGYWAQPYIDVTANLGIGFKKDDYTKPLVRKDVAYIIMSALRLIEHEEEYNYMNLAREEIIDLYKLESFVHIKNILQLYTKGIMKGYKDDTYRPYRLVTRAEAVVLLERILDKNKRDPFNPDISNLPHTEIPTYFGDTKTVVFPDWEMKKAYDLIFSNDDKTNGLIHKGFGSISAIYYKDEEQYQREVERMSSVQGMFKPPIQDIYVGFGTTHNTYDLSINVGEKGSWERHRLAIRPFLKQVFGKDSKTFEEYIINNIEDIENKEFEVQQYELNNRKVIVNGNDDLKYLYFDF